MNSVGTLPCKNDLPEVAPCVSLPRVLLVRHGKQISYDARIDQSDIYDPQLSDIGIAQADKLATRLGTELSGCRTFIISSPMRRAIQTASPIADAIGVRINVHGGIYEYKCAGRDFPGVSIAQTAVRWPNCNFTEYRPDGYWNYVGNFPMEIESETRERGLQFVRWLSEGIFSGPLKDMDAIVVVAHQTFLDLVVQILLGERPSNWRYGKVKYKLAHTAISELMPNEDASSWSLVETNDRSHIQFQLH